MLELLGILGRVRFWWEGGVVGECEVKCGFFKKKCIY